MKIVDGGLEDKPQPLPRKEPADLRMGGERREGSKDKLVTDVGNRILRDLGRSDDCCHECGRMKLTQRQKSAES